MPVGSSRESEPSLSPLPPLPPREVGPPLSSAGGVDLPPAVAAAA